MPDAIRATTSLMEAESSKIKIRSAYNLSAVDFTPTEIALSIRAHIPEFEMNLCTRFLQAIADSWPQSIDDSSAREHWGWSMIMI